MKMKLIKDGQVKVTKSLELVKILIADGWKKFEDKVEKVVEEIEEEIEEVIEEVKPRKRK